MTSSSSHPVSTRRDLHFLYTAYSFDCGMLPWPAGTAHATVPLGQFLPGSAKIVSVIPPTRISTLIAHLTPPLTLPFGLSSDAVLPLILYQPFFFWPVERKTTLTVLLEYLVLCNSLSTGCLLLSFCSAFVYCFPSSPNSNTIRRFLASYPQQTSPWYPSHIYARLRS